MDLIAKRSDGKVITGDALLKVDPTELRYYLSTGDPNEAKILEYLKYALSIDGPRGVRVSVRTSTSRDLELSVGYVPRDEKTIGF